MLYRLIVSLATTCGQVVTMKVSAKGFSIYLNTPTIDDAEAIRENANDREIAINVPNIPNPYGIENALQFIGFAIQKYELKEDFHMCIRLLNGEFIGLCALVNIDKLNRKAELGYWVGAKYRGKGFAKEALRLIIGFGFSYLDLNRIYAKVLVHNERSVNLLNSLNFRKEGTNRDDVFHDGRFMDDVIFGVLKREYKDGIGVIVEDY